MCSENSQNILVTFVMITPGFLHKLKSPIVGVSEHTSGHEYWIRCSHIVQSNLSIYQTNWIMISELACLIHFCCIYMIYDLVVCGMPQGIYHMIHIYMICVLFVRCIIIATGLQVSYLHCVYEPIVYGLLSTCMTSI